MAFQIRKETTSGIWNHSDSLNTSNDLRLSDGFFNTVDTRFNLFSETGGLLRTADLTEIEVIDETDVSAIETFTTVLLLVTRLKALGYPYF
ncbi:MAG: hypothetical protein ACUZ8H_01355 [Candidatus Anammoxibacter sp.]